MRGGRQNPFQRPVESARPRSRRNPGHRSGRGPGQNRRAARLAGLALAILFLTGCSSFPWRHAIQGDNWVQVLQSEASQVKVRNAQSRVYDTTDTEGMLAALVATYQDLGFQVEVLDETLGIISGKRYLDAERPGDGGLASYLLYDEQGLVVFNRVYRTWGPFQARADMVRLTATIRKRNAEQLIVRASSQYFLRPVESPEAYQKFFAALEQSLFQHRASHAPLSLEEAVQSAPAVAVPAKTPGAATAP